MLSEPPENGLDMISREDLSMLNRETIRRGRDKPTQTWFVVEKYRVGSLASEVVTRLEPVIVHARI